MTPPRPDKPRMCAYCGIRPVWKDERHVRLCRVCRDRHDNPNVDQEPEKPSKIQSPFRAPEPGERACASCGTGLGLAALSRRIRCLDCSRIVEMDRRKALPRRSHDVDPDAGNPAQV